MLHFELLAAIVLAVFAVAFCFNAILPNLLPASILNQIMFWHR